MKTGKDFSRPASLLIEFVQRRQVAIFMVATTILALLLRENFRGYESKDYIFHLLPWSRYLEENGGFKGIVSIQSDYPVSYLYFLALFTYVPFTYLTEIKLLSVAFDFLAAYFVYKIVKKARNDAPGSYIPYLAFALSLFIPTVVMNGAIWAQCDIIYVAFILISLYCLMEEKFPLAFLFFGLALSFKLQAIFLLPVFVWLYFRSVKFSLLNVLIIPIVYFLIYLPAVGLGKPVSDLFATYSTQVTEYKFLVKNFANLYSLLPQDYDLFFRGGLILGLTVVGIFTLLIIRDKHVEAHPKTIIEVALLSVMLSTYFLPSMHERYMFAADLLAVIYLFLNLNRFYIPLIIWFINANCYMPYLLDRDPWLSFQILALLNLAVQVILLIDLFGLSGGRPAAKESK